MAMQGTLCAEMGAGLKIVWRSSIIALHPDPGLERRALAAVVPFPVCSACALGKFSLVAAVHRDVERIALMIPAILAASAGLLFPASPHQPAAVYSPPRASVHLSAAGEELRACLLLARGARQRSACFAGFSLEDLLDEGDLVRRSRSRIAHSSSRLGGNCSGGRRREVLGRQPLTLLPTPALQIVGGQSSTEIDRIGAVLLEAKQSRPYSVSTR
jgi:hypothetical protein